MVQTKSGKFTILKLDTGQTTSTTSGLFRKPGSQKIPEFSTGSLYTNFNWLDFSAHK